MTQYVLVKNNAISCYFSVNSNETKDTIKFLLSKKFNYDFDKTIENSASENSIFDCIDDIPKTANYLHVLDCYNECQSCYRITKNDWISLKSICIPPFEC